MAGSIRVMQLISNLEIGGAQEVVRTLADYLARAGCVPVVVTFKDGPLRGEIERLGIPVEILPERRHSVLELPAFWREMTEIRRRLLTLIEKYNINVIQTHLLRSLDFLVLTLRSGRTPLLFWTFHNQQFDLRGDHLPRHKWLLKPKRFSHHLLYRLGTRWINGIIAVSEDVKTSILETLRGIPAHKVAVICNSVDLERYARPANRQAVREALGVSATDHVMTMVATFKHQKGHEYLIEAASLVAPHCQHLHIFLIGDGELQTRLKALTQTLNLHHNIHFLGTRSDIPDLLAASDSFVLPSLWEGLPMALIEAMAGGLPSIATDVSGTNQVMVAGQTGLLVAPGNARQLSQAMLTLLSDPAQARKMGAAARQRVETLFGAQKQADEHLALFQRELQRAEVRLFST